MRSEKAGKYMGFFDRLRRKPPKTQKWAQTLNGYAPVFSQFGTNIYASDVVQQAIKCIVDEMKKLNPVHIRYNGNDPVPVNSDIQTVLNNPNPLMTTSEFLEKVMWLLLLNYNAFILPTYYMWEDERGIQKRKYSGLYPLKPTQVDFIEDASGRMYVKMRSKQQCHMMTSFTSSTIIPSMNIWAVMRPVSRITQHC